MGENGENLFWWEEKTWLSDKGFKITERIAAGQVPDDFPRFVSIMTFSMKPPGMPPQNVNMVFPIEANGISEAMRNYEKTAKDKGPELQKQAIVALQEKLNDTHRQILVPRSNGK